MYKLFSTNDEITLWCEGRLPPDQPTKGGRKRKADELEQSTKTDKIDELAHELYQKHGETYSMQQFRLWARMLLNKQYKSMETAPPYPPFQEKIHKTCKQENSLSDALTSAATAVVGLLQGESATLSPGVSPGKRAHVSGQYLEQLEKFKKLRGSEVLSAEEFEEQKKFALDNIRKLNS